MFRNSRRLAFFVFFVAASLCFTLAAWSQTATGSILGTVTDGTGAAVPNVAITIKSLATGTTRSMTSRGHSRENGSLSTVPKARWSTSVRSCR